MSLREDEDFLALVQRMGPITGPRKPIRFVRPPATVSSMGIRPWSEIRAEAAARDPQFEEKVAAKHAILEADIAPPPPPS